MRISPSLNKLSPGLISRAGGGLNPNGRGAGCSGESPLVDLPHRRLKTLFINMVVPFVHNKHIWTPKVAGQTKLLANAQNKNQHHLHSSPNPFLEVCVFGGGLRCSGHRKPIYAMARAQNLLLKRNTQSNTKPPRIDIKRNRPQMQK